MQAALELLERMFIKARTYKSWLTPTISETEFDVRLRKAYDLAKMAPTSMNCSPMRILFIRTPRAKEKLRHFLDPGNVEKMMQAPITAIVAYDYKFYDYLDRLAPFPHAQDYFVGNSPLIEETAFRNGTLQGAYFLIALRAMGFDCGPMSGFDNAGIDKAFFPRTQIKSNFLINIGFGDPATLYPRTPRFEFEEVCKIV